MLRCEFTGGSGRRKLSWQTNRLVPVLFLLVIILIPSLLTRAHGAEISATVTSNSVTIQMNLELVENLTTSLPLLDTVQTQPGPVQQAVQTGFQSMVPNARVDQLTLHARTAEINNRTNLWVLQENYTMKVSGVTTNTGGRIIANLAFLSSKNNQSIQVSGVELNNVGRTYMLEALKNFPPGTGTRYFAEGSEYTLPVIPEQFSAIFSLLDLSWTSSVRNWAGGYQPFNSSTNWNLAPRLPRYNVTVGTGLEVGTQTEGQGIFVKRYVALFDTTMEIIAPPRSEISGTTITFDIPTAAETIMPIIIVVSLLATVTTFMLERKVSKQTRWVRAKKH